MRVKSLLPGRKADDAQRQATREADEARDRGDPARAATLYGAVLERWGPNFGLLVQMGNALKDSGAYERAEEAYAAALRIEPADADCHLQLGHLMKLAGKPDLAEAYYREANRLGPELPGPLDELASIEERKTAAAVEPPLPAPARMQVQAADRGSRSVAMRQRLVGGFAWRRG